MTRVSYRSATGRMRRLVAIGAIALAGVGCASQKLADPRDPWEPFNRGVFAFNEGVDEAILKPVATVYRDVTPALVRAGVSNFLSNLDDAWSFVNNLLQLKGRSAVDNFFRFGVNTTFGLAGVLDVASEMEIERHSEDFGQTLGYWGVGPGPFLVLPMFGPSTLRDALGLRVDMVGDIASTVEPTGARNSLRVLNVIETRAGLLSVTSALDDVALDKYLFAREAYLQRRRNAIYDGDPPEERVDWDSGKP